MSALSRPLSGCIVGLSISEGTETAALGFPASEVNRTTLRVVAALLGQGAGVAFGHDWRDDGVMESVHAYVERFQPPAGEGRQTPLLQNLVAWPDKTRLADADRERLKNTLRLEEAGLPASLARHADHPDPNTLPYLRARALTHLRHKLTVISHARVCLGGRLTGYAGRYPGIVEEAYLAVRARQPIFIAGVLGGAASHIIQALKQRNSPSDLCPENPLILAYHNPPVDEAAPEDPDDLNWSAQTVWQTFASLGVNGLSASNKLSPDENEQLFTTQSIDETIELILTALGRIPEERRH